MGKYNFVSPGAVAGNAIEEFLRQRILDQRQQMLDSVLVQDKHADNQRADADLSLREQQARMMNEDRDRAQSAREDENNYRRAANYATTGVPGIIAADDAENLKKYGFGGLIQAPAGDAAAAPGVLQFAGGTQYQSARQAEAARMAQQKEAEAARGEQMTAAQQAAAERAAADRETRMQIAQVGAQGRNATADIDRRLKEQKFETEEEKKATAAKKAQDQDNGIKKYKTELRSVIDELIDENGNLRPDTARVVGPISARTPDWFGASQTAQSKIEHAIGLLDLNKLGELKAQSRTGATGFGALSAPELQVLEYASSTLKNRKQSEPEYAKELKRIRDGLVMTDTPGAAQGGSERVVVVAPNGQRGTIPAAQLQQAIAKGYKRAQ